MPALLEAESTDKINLHITNGTVYEHIDFGIQMYGSYNDTRPNWFADNRVRQAMTLCTNRQKMVDSLLFSKAEIAHSYLPATHPLYPPNLPEWHYDPAQGNQLLDEVTFTDTDEDGVREYQGEIPWWRGTPFRISLLYDESHLLQPQLGTLFQEDMRLCGIEVALVGMPAETLYGSEGEPGPLFGRRFDLAAFAWKAENEPSCNLYQSQQIPGSPSEGFCGWRQCVNASGFQSPLYDTACQNAQQALPESFAFAENHHTAQQIFAEQLPSIPLFWRVNIAATRPEVVGFSLDPTQTSPFETIAELDLVVGEGDRE